MKHILKRYRLAVIALAILALNGCQNRKSANEKSEQPISVRTQKIGETILENTITLSANMEGNKTVRLGFMVPGKIDYIAAEEGEAVQKGELLASLEQESYRIALEMADAQLDQAQDDYKRLNELHKRNSLSESDYSKITNSLRVARAQQHLQAKNLADTRLLSPIKGVLLKKGTEVGEIIDKGLPLFVISDIYTMKANASIPEAELHRIKIGDKASVYLAALDSTVNGKILEIGTLADAATRTFSIKVELNNPDLLIRPGMTAEVKLQTNTRSTVISIPAEAILHDGDNSSYVYVVDTTAGKAFKRMVSLGEIRQNNIQITSGLNENDLLVVAGQFKLHNGSAISIK